MCNQEINSLITHFICTLDVISNLKYLNKKIITPCSHFYGRECS